MPPPDPILSVMFGAMLMLYLHECHQHERALQWHSPSNRHLVRMIAACVGLTIVAICMVIVSITG